MDIKLTPSQRSALVMASSRLSGENYSLLSDRDSKVFQDRIDVVIKELVSVSPEAFNADTIRKYSRKGK
jgi:predicted oxidoreductase (fatty acid repression mutant protein)